MVRLKISGPASSSATIIPTELLNDQGDIFDDLCQGQSYWVYTLAGKGVESYHSKFFYRGGRYLKVELQPAPGSAETPRLISIAADTIHADSPSVGQFSCSNDRFNKIYSLIRWAQMNNMISVMTDCPTREKLGYLEEDHLNGPALRYNFDISLLTNKIVNDMSDSQHENGLVPTAPDYPHWSESGPFASITTAPGWGSAFIQMPWQQYLFTGDLSHLRTHYAAMKRYVNYLSSRAQDNILKFGLGDWYDNHGAGPPQLTPSSVTDTTFFYQDHQILARVATLLNHPDDARHFEQSASAILASYNNTFFNPTTGNYSTGSQSANSMPLAMGMVPEASRPAVLSNLVNDFQNKGETAGEVSMQSLINALASGGHSDLIYSTFNTDKEGYGLQVKLGKTSLTEGWNGGSSQDHFMFGQINEWFYHDLAGIQQDPASVGFKKIVIKPSMVGDLTYVRASYDSIQGKIISNWSRTAKELTMKVTIPIGSTATVYVPAGNPRSVQESGKPISSASGVRYMGYATGYSVYAVGSGNYLFSAPIH